MSSTHEGVSCDGCMAPNFAGDRYKCLRCYDFDLCARCYAEERAEGRAEARTLRESGDEHLPTHPMQCIMTQQDFKLTYQGDQSHSWDKLRVVIFTCPVCGAQGLSREHLVSHVIEEHSAPPRSPSSQRFEMACPICISTDFYRVGFGDYMPNQLTDMVAHMQEHHAQPPSSSSSSNVMSRGSEVGVRGGGLSDFLRDRELRRVIMHSVPLIGRESDFEDSATESAQRGSLISASTHRGGDGFSRVRRRIVADRPADTQANEERSSPQPPFGFRPLSTRQRTGGTAAQQIANVGQVSGEGGTTNNSTSDGQQRLRSLRQEVLTSESSRNSASASQRSVASSRTTILIPSSQRNVRSTTASTGNASFSRTFQSPITSFSRATVPRTQPAVNASSRSNTIARTGARTGGSQNDAGNSSSQLLISDATRIMVESQLHRGGAEIVAHRAEASRQGIRAALRRERNHNEVEPVVSTSGQTRRGRGDTRNSAPSTQGADTLSSSWTRPARAAVRAGRTSTRQQQSNSDVATAGFPAHPLMTNSSGRPVLVLSPSSQQPVVCEQLTQAVTESAGQNETNEAKRKELSNMTLVEANASASFNGKTRASGQGVLCPLFTSCFKLTHPLPILRIERAKVACSPKVEMLKDRVLSVLESNKKEVSNGISPMRLIMRVGRPLKSSMAQHGGALMLMDVVSADSDSHWWNRRDTSHYDSDTLLRHSRRSRQTAAQNQSAGSSSPLHVARPSVSRGEVTAVPISGALDVIRRLDARSARSHRPSPTQSDAAAAASNNDNVPPSSTIRQYYQIPTNILSGSYLSGRDPSVVEAVARDVAAFSEACGFHLRHLHNLIRRSESAASNASPSGGRSLSRHGALQRNEARPRGPARLHKTRDNCEEELSDYFHAAFKATDVDVLLDGPVAPRRRLFKPFRVKSDQETEQVLTPWLRKEESLDALTVISDEPSCAAVNALFAQIPEFVNDELVDDDLGREIHCESVDEPMFEAGKGSDDEMLEKKCQSSDLNRTQAPHIVAGPVSAVPSEQAESENDYWKDYRFLHNRRDVFLLKKSIDVPPESIFDASDWRFPRQLLLGTVDVPASVYLRSHYLPHMFSRVLRSNLRGSLEMMRGNGTAQSADRSLLSDSEEMFEFDNARDLQWQRHADKEGEGNPVAYLHVHPTLWHVLDLAGFVEIRS